jgi:hypothetical protein
VVANQDADWWQPHPGARTLPLNAGGVLRFANGEDVTGTQGCAVARLVPSTATWQCTRLAGTLRGVVRQDSTGRLVEAYPASGDAGVVLATSADGGRHWRQVTLTPPRGAGTRLETPSMYDVVANGRLGEAVVSARFDDAAGHGHDMVFRVSTAGSRPHLERTYLVGKGDINTANDVTGSAGYRFDYESVTLFPDGAIAVSFDDSTCVQPSLRDSSHRSPEVAILI